MRPSSALLSAGCTSPSGIRSRLFGYINQKKKGVLDCKTVGFFSQNLTVSHAKRARASKTHRRACETRERVLLASLSSLILRFQPHSRPFWTVRANLNTQNYGLFCSLRACSIDLAYSAIRIKGTNSKNHPSIEKRTRRA